MTRAALLAVLAACGGSSSPPPAKPAAAEAPAKGPSEEELAAQHAREEQAKHDDVVASHRKIEEAQQTALAATCDEPADHAPHERCLPSCYPTEPKDARAGKKLGGAVEIQHLVCEPTPGNYVIADELAPKLQLRAARGRFPTAHKKGSWQADVESALAALAHDKKDALVVTGAWHDTSHPLIHEHMRCVTVSHYTHAMHRAVDGCGTATDVTCEAAGNAAARGINVVHYRLSEARQLQSSGKNEECQQAALEAIAVSRGLPRWRQYAKLNVQQWKDHAAYRTRFDGLLDEDALFAAAASLGAEAESVYTTCGGPAGAPTTPEQEQSFHTCW